MLKFFGGQERTFDHLEELLLGTGWKINKVRRPSSAGLVFQFYEALPFGVATVGRAHDVCPRCELVLEKGLNTLLCTKN